MRHRHFLLLGILVFTLAVPAMAQDPAEAPFTEGISDAASLKRVVDARIARARRLLDGVLAVTGTRTIANTLTPYDDLLGELYTAGSQARVMAALHPDEPMRRAGEDLNRAVSALAAEIPLRADVYAALKGIDVRRADARTRYYVERELKDFELAGVDKPEAARQRLQQLRDQLTQAMEIGRAPGRAGAQMVEVTAVVN